MRSQIGKPVYEMNARSVAYMEKEQGWENEFLLTDGLWM